MALPIETNVSDQRATRNFEALSRLFPLGAQMVQTGTFLRLNTTGTDRRLSFGATSVADGGTITHGFTAAPSVVVATASTTGEFVSVTAIGATTATLAIKKHDNTAGTTQT